MSIFKNIWKLIKRLLGFPPAPKPEQVNEVLITMRESRDCHVAAVATACNEVLKSTGRRITYEAASKALWHWNLPFFLESPLLSNPLNLCRGIEKLGCKANDKIKISELLKGELKPGSIICLMHDPSGQISGIIGQHWVVWMGKDKDGHLFHWGMKQALKTYSEKDTIDMLTSGWPNCIVEVSC